MAHFQFRIIAVFLMLTLNSACCFGPSKPSYPKAAVQPVTIKRVSENTIRIRYKIPPETVWYSKGIRYLQKDNTLKIFIDRSPIKSQCQPDIKQTPVPDQPWQAEITLPYHGERVMMIYRDTEEQIYP